MMNSLFYYLVTAHEHQEGFGAVAKTTELYQANKDLFESLWEGAIAKCENSDKFDLDRFKSLLAQHGLYIQFESGRRNRRTMQPPVYEMDLRIYPVEIGDVACLKVSVCEHK